MNRRLTGDDTGQGIGEQVRAGKHAAIFAGGFIIGKIHFETFVNTGDHDAHRAFAVCMGQAGILQGQGYGCATEPGVCIESPVAGRGV